MQVPSGTLKKELLEHLAKVPAFVQQLQFSVKNSTVGKAATFTKVDSVIQETKNLMNFVSKTVTSCLTCSSKVRLYDGNASSRATECNVTQCHAELPAAQTATPPNILSFLFFLIALPLDDTSDLIFASLYRSTILKCCPAPVASRPRAATARRATTTASRAWARGAAAHHPTRIYDSTGAAAQSRARAAETPDALVCLFYSFRVKVLIGQICRALGLVVQVPCSLMEGERLRSDARLAVI